MLNPSITLKLAPVPVPEPVYSPLDSYFLELRNHFWGKILEFFDADPGSGMEKSQIQDPG